MKHFRLIGFGAAVVATVAVTAVTSTALANPAAVTGQGPVPAKPSTVQAGPVKSQVKGEDPYIDISSSAKYVKVGQEYLVKVVVRSQSDAQHATRIHVSELFRFANGAEKTVSHLGDYFQLVGREKSFVRSFRLVKKEQGTAHYDLSVSQEGSDRVALDGVNVTVR